MTLLCYRMCLILYPLVFRVTVPVEEKESTSLYKVVSVTPSSAYGDLTTGRTAAFMDHSSLQSMSQASIHSLPTLSVLVIS